VKTTAHRLFTALAARFVATCPLCGTRVNPGQVMCTTCANR
jgi:hypothetical protein